MAPRLYKKLCCKLFLYSAPQDTPSGFKSLDNSTKPVVDKSTESQHHMDQKLPHLCDQKISSNVETPPFVDVDEQPSYTDNQSPSPPLASSPPLTPSPPQIIEKNEAPLVNEHLFPVSDDQPSPATSKNDLPSTIPIASKNLFQNSGLVNKFANEDPLYSQCLDEKSHSANEESDMKMHPHSSKIPLPSDYVIPQLPGKSEPPANSAKPLDVQVSSEKSDEALHLVSEVPFDSPSDETLPSTNEKSHSEILHVKSPNDGINPLATDKSPDFSNNEVPPIPSEEPLHSQSSGNAPVPPGTKSFPPGIVIFNN